MWKVSWFYEKVHNIIFWLCRYTKSNKQVTFHQTLYPFSSQIIVGFIVVHLKTFGEDVHIQWYGTQYVN